MVDKYIEMRNSGQYNIVWFYDYYNLNGGKAIDLNQFHSAFQMYGLNDIVAGLDKKLNLNSILDKNGNTIKILKNE